MKAKISRLRERDKKLYQQLLTETRSKFEIQGIYQPMSLQLESLRQNITVFNIKEIRKSDFSRGELKWNEEEISTVIGRGTFSTVYRGVLSQRGQLEIKVALKVYRNPLQSHNVWHFIDEERALRFVFFLIKFSRYVSYYADISGPIYTNCFVVLRGFPYADAPLST